MPGLQLVVVACTCLQVLPTSSVARRVLHSAGVVTPVCRMLQGGDACAYCWQRCSVGCQRSYKLLGA
jgi:hypothetical protein